MRATRQLSTFRNEASSPIDAGRMELHKLQVLHSRTSGIGMAGMSMAGTSVDGISMEGIRTEPAHNFLGWPPLSTKSHLGPGAQVQRQDLRQMQIQHRPP